MYTLQKSQAWIGEAVKNVNVESSSSEDAEDVPQDKKKNSGDVAGFKTELVLPHLYIQMEACAQYTFCFTSILNVYLFL